MALKLTRSNINGYFNDFSIYSFLKNNLHELNGKVLDIGCGKMHFKKIIESSPKVKEYIGLDLEPGKFNYSSKADIYWDGVTMPIPDNSIDSSILFEVIEHCENPNIVISEAYRVLKPGGTILFSSPFLYQLHGIPNDHQRFTPFGLESAMKRNGFKDIKIIPSGSWDASLGQMFSIWITRRPMPSIVRKILSLSFVPIFQLLLFFDRKQTKDNFSENDIMPGLLGIARK
jgi:SAM-dependent methyltransferase